jgi:hypothetical protein
MHCLIRSTINQIQNKLIKQVPLLNKGGCIVFAQLLSEALELRNIPYQVILIDHEIEYITHTISALQKQRYGATMSVFHVMLKIEGCYVDGHVTYNNLSQLNGDYSDEDFYVKNFKASSESLLKYSEFALWNETYDVSNNHLIKQIIQKEFNKYDEIKNMS